MVLAAALNGIAVLKAYFSLFTGTRQVSSVPLDVSIRERLAVLTFVALMIAGGVFPQPGVASRHHAAHNLLILRGEFLSNKVRDPLAAVSGSSSPAPLGPGHVSVNGSGREGPLPFTDASYLGTD